MRAVWLRDFGAPTELHEEDTPEPSPAPGTASRRTASTALRGQRNFRGLTRSGGGNRPRRTQARIVCGVTANISATSVKARTGLVISPVIGGISDEAFKRGPVGNVHEAMQRIVALRARRRHGGGR